MADGTSDADDGDPGKSADADPAQGDPAQGDPAQGDPAQGDPGHGDSAQGDPGQNDDHPGKQVARLRAFRQHDTEPDDGPPRHPPRRRLLRWLGMVAALITLSAVGLAMLWSWVLSARVGHRDRSDGSSPPGNPDPTATPDPSATPTATPGSTDGPGVSHPAGVGASHHTNTVTCDSTSCDSDACDSTCSDTSDSCNRSCDSGDSCGSGSGCDSSGSGCDSSGDGCSSGGGGGSSAAGRLSLLAADLAQPALHLPTGLLSRRAGVGARLGAAAIRWYQRRISPRRPARCRYVPSCSHYGLAAVQRYGLLAGASLAMARIRRCTKDVRPGTVDPPPTPDQPVASPNRCSPTTLSI